MCKCKWDAQECVDEEHVCVRVLMLQLVCKYVMSLSQAKYGK